MESEEHPTELEIEVPPSEHHGMAGKVRAGDFSLSEGTIRTGFVAYVNTANPEGRISWNVALNRADALKLGLYLVRCAIRGKVS